MRQVIPLAAKLEFSCDPDAVSSDLSRIAGADWGEHRSALGEINGKRGWSTLSLRAVDGNARDTSPGLPGRGQYSDTPLLRRLPQISEVVHRFPFPTASIRLSAMHPGGEIAPHKGLLGFHTGRVRLHLPLKTNPDAILYVDGQHFCWGVGELWYADFSKTHSVENRGNETRIHAIVDAYVTPDLISLFPEPARAHLSTPDAQSSGLVTLFAPPLDLSGDELARYACQMRLQASHENEFIHEFLNRMLATSSFAPASLVSFSPDTRGLAISCDGSRVATLEPCGSHAFRPIGGLPCDTFTFSIDGPQRPSVRIGTFVDRHVEVDLPAIVA